MPSIPGVPQKLFPTHPHPNLKLGNDSDMSNVFWHVL